MDVAAPRAGSDRPPYADLRALVLTHAHFDHVGFARRAQAELELPVFCGRASLDAIAPTHAQIVLPRHGEPWREGAVRAAELARVESIG